MIDFDDVWRRIVRLEGEVFRQKTGKPFTYSISSGCLVPSTTNRQLARSQFAQALSRFPVPGPGKLQDLQGPSYLWAILSDPRVGGVDHVAVDAPLAHTVRIDGAPDATMRDAANPAAAVALSEDRPGCRLSERALRDLGFIPLASAVTRVGVAHAGGIGSEWTTEGDVPDAPGLYAFTVQKQGDQELRVMYVGMTEHLWMVTKGSLPTGGARPGQRYGRPIYAGVTRQRINVEITRAMCGRSTVTHWVRPLRTAPVARAELRSVLLTQEANLIRIWQLRQVGWNRG